MFQSKIVIKSKIMSNQVMFQIWSWYNKNEVPVRLCLGTIPKIPTGLHFNSTEIFWRRFLSQIYTTPIKGLK